MLLQGQWGLEVVSKGKRSIPVAQWAASEALKSDFYYQIKKTTTPKTLKIAPFGAMSTTVHNNTDDTRTLTFHTTIPITSISPKLHHTQCEGNEIFPQQKCNLEGKHLDCVKQIGHNCAFIALKPMFARALE